MLFFPQLLQCSCPYYALCQTWFCYSNYLLNFAGRRKLFTPEEKVLLNKRIPNLAEATSVSRLFSNYMCWIHLCNITHLHILNELYKMQNICIDKGNYLLFVVHRMH